MFPILCIWPGRLRAWAWGHSIRAKRKLQRLLTPSTIKNVYQITKISPNVYIGWKFDGSFHSEKGITDASLTLRLLLIRLQRVYRRLRTPLNLSTVNWGTMVHNAEVRLPINVHTLQSSIQCIWRIATHLLPASLSSDIRSLKFL